MLWLAGHAMTKPHRHGMFYLTEAATLRDSEKVCRRLPHADTYGVAIVITYSALTASFRPTGFNQGCGGKWIVKQKIEHTVIVLRYTFDASRAPATVTHPALFHCVVPWCWTACVSIHHVCECCTKADPLQNRLQSVIHIELSLTTGWPWHYSDGDCLTNKHFHFTSAGSSQCCCSGYTYCIEDTLNWKKKKGGQCY